MPQKIFEDILKGRVIEILQNRDAFMDNLREKRKYHLKNVNDGVWYMIHLLACRGNYIGLVEAVNTLMEAFVCTKCRGHLVEYINVNPIPKIDTLNSMSSYKIRVILYEWTINYRNDIQILSKKDVLDDETILKIFFELTDLADEEGEIYVQTGECGSGCDENLENVKSSPPLKENVYPSDAIGDVKIVPFL